MMLEYICASLYWCTPLDGSIQCREYGVRKDRECDCSTEAQEK
jgi:hypothetical protein